MERGAPRVAEAGIAAELAPFFHDVAAIVEARASGDRARWRVHVAEIAVAGRPAIFIPLPSAIDDHQRANADALAELGAAWRLDQHGLTPRRWRIKIEKCIDES